MSRCDELGILEAMFSNKKTGIPKYDDFLKDPDYADKKGVVLKVMSIPPELYIDAVYSNVKKSGEYSGSKDALISTRRKEIIDKLRNTKNIDMPIFGLDAGYLFQEGLHRALAAIANGEKKMPVLLTYRDSKDIPKEFKKYV